eukprot:6585887-Alexandrium_andersonii.AAC.2
MLDVRMWVRDTAPFGTGASQLCGACGFDGVSRLLRVRVLHARMWVRAIALLGRSHVRGLWSS